MVIINRSKSGKNPTRHGIVLRGLKPIYQRTLKKYDFIKEDCEDDRFVNMLFSMIDRETNLKNRSKYFIDPTDNKVKPRKKLQEEIRIIPWHCSFCQKEIQSKMEDFSIKNFTCKTCYDKYTNNGKKVSELILNNSVKFTEHCKSLLNKDRRNFLKYITK